MNLEYRAAHILPVGGFRKTPRQHTHNAAKSQLMFAFPNRSKRKKRYLLFKLPRKIAPRENHKLAGREEIKQKAKKRKK